MWKCTVALAAGFLTAANAQMPSALVTQTGGPQPAHGLSITANLAVTGANISSNFVGFSTEVGDFVNGFYQGTSGQWTSNGVTGNAASFIGVVNLLGSTGVFRLGGGSSDAGTPPTITSGMANNLASFLTALGANWSLVYGLDLVANNSAAAASTASTIATAVGASKITFAFGNEPSLNGINNATYISEWNAYYAAVTGSVAGAKYSAVDDIINLGWGSVPTTIAALTPGIAGMGTIGVHWYPFSNGVFPNPIPAILLSQVQMQQFASGGLPTNNGLGQYLINYASYGAVPQRLSETNSISARGQTGMSDRLLGATWFLTTAIGLVQYGWTGMNVHNVWTGGVGVYNTVVAAADNNFVPTPVFYGMYLFSKIQGQQTVTVAYSNNVSNLIAIATKGGNGNANILAVNSDAFNPIVIKPDQSNTWSTANVLQVKSAKGAGCGDASVTVGGQAFGESGTWTGAPFAISKGQSITLGPCESALISIQP